MPVPSEIDTVVYEKFVFSAKDAVESIVPVSVNIADNNHLMFFI